MGCKINPSTISKLLVSLTEFFDSKYRGLTYTITDLRVRPGCKEVDNFLSVIHKVELTTKVSNPTKPDSGNISNGVIEEEHRFNLICKSTILEDDGQCDNLSKLYWSILFTKEKIVYDFLHSLSSELGCEIQPLCPKLHHSYSEGEEYTCIVLQDLISQGFYIPKVLDVGISLEECQLIMKNLARLHVLSLVLEGKDNSPLPIKHELACLEVLFSNEVESAVRPLVDASFQGVLNLAERFRPDLFSHLKRIDDDEKIWCRLIALVRRKSSFSTLCHGDPRTNNIFIHKSHSPDKPSKMGESKKVAVASNGNDANNKNGSPEISANYTGLRFIDFQLTRYSSPVTDLQYAIHMSTNREFREKYTDIVLETYYNEFQKVLGQFPDVKLVQEEGVKSWTLEILKEEYRQFYMYGFLVSLILLPMILLRPGDIDKSISQMRKEERTKFFVEGRSDLIVLIGSKNHDMRERLFELCDEMLAKNLI